MFRGKSLCGSYQVLATRRVVAADNEIRYRNHLQEPRNHFPRPSVTARVGGKASCLRPGAIDAKEKRKRVERDVSFSFRHLLLEHGNNILEVASARGSTRCDR